MFFPPPSFPTLPPDSSEELRTIYRAWLHSRRPYDERGRQVAKSPIIRGIAKGHLWSQDPNTAKAWQQLHKVWNAFPHRVWIWSDLHLSHQRICELASRPFASVNEMNHRLLANAQEKVGPDDWLLFLGDIAFMGADSLTSWLSDCPGHKALLMGNHDVNGLWARANPDPRCLGFEAVSDVLDWPLATPLEDRNGDRIDRLWFTHYPLWRDWIPSGVRNVHGHIHKDSYPGPFINVSVEHTDYAPRLLIDVVRTSGRL